MKRKPALCTALLIGAVLSTSASAEWELLAVEAAGLLPLDGENRIVLESLRGSVTVQVGRESQLRFMSRAPGRNGAEMPVEVWHEAGTLRITAPAGSEDDERTLQVIVPEFVASELRLDRSRIELTGLRRDVTIRGAELAVEARGVDASIYAQLTGGRFRSSRIGGDLDLGGSGMTAEVLGVGGNLILNVSDGDLTIDDVRGDLTADLHGTDLVLDGVSGVFELDADGGSADVSGLQLGGDLRLAGTVLRLTHNKGDISVATDAEVRFEDNEASLHIDNYGGSVRGTSNDGLVEVKTDHSDIVMEAINGPVRVQGDGLRVNLSKIGGELILLLTASQLEIDGASSAVTIESEFGDVRLQNTSGAVDVTSRQGDVWIAAASGPVSVSADGEVVDVGWTSMSRDKDSRIVNESGDVTVRLPKQGGAALNAAARYGRVEAEHPDVRVSQDGNFASGVINRMSRPSLTIESGGDVYVLQSGSGGGES